MNKLKHSIPGRILHRLYLLHFNNYTYISTMEYLHEVALANRVWIKLSNLKTGLQNYY